MGGDTIRRQAPGYEPIPQASPPVACLRARVGESVGKMLNVNRDGEPLRRRSRRWRSPDPRETYWETGVEEDLLAIQRFLSLCTGYQTPGLPSAGWLRLAPCKAVL